MKKPLPIGYDNFEHIISNNLYYVDKTLLVKDILDNAGQTNLVTRPRRFGKTLALSMLKYFFEKSYDNSGNIIDNKDLFKDTKIMEAGEKYLEHMGQYPVINLSLKSAKQPNFEMAYESLIDDIANEYLRHSYILQWDMLDASEKEQFILLMQKEANDTEYAKAIGFLSKCLFKAYGKKVIILIDEYDVPLENAYFEGFYSQMIAFIRSLFESALKTNIYLKLAVVTGCLRISRESIFTGLNNLKVVSISSKEFSEHFGFVQSEIDEILKYFDIEQKSTQIKEWYNGYLFGDTQVYNPWSIVNYINDIKFNINANPKPYWSNTSSNSIVRELVERADIAVKQDIEKLISGGTIEMPIHEDITYEDVYKTQDNLWNFLYFTGYLKKASERFEYDTTYVTLTIPNIEVRYIYKRTILEWFEQETKKSDLTMLYKAVQTGDCEVFADMVTNQLVETISFYDYAENYYHGFLCGLLKACPGFGITSNRESGNGRPDIIMKTPSVRGMAIIMELKTVKGIDDMEQGCNMAMKQIEENNYQAALQKEGYRKILKYGICFYRKECLVVNN